MPSVNQIKQELDDITTLRDISSAFTEASAGKIRVIRTDFERNRQFYEEISHVYQLVKVSARRRKRAQLKSASLPKTLSVALTSNQRFYGAINTNIMRTFVAQTENANPELLVLGTTGIDYLKSTGFTRPYAGWEFAKNLPDTNELNKFLDKITPYDTVLLYYPKFVTLLSQAVGITDIAKANAKAELDVPAEEIHILYEPEFGKIKEFFERQVRLALFHYVLLETDLARTAARLLAMSSAEERATDMVKDKKTQLRKVMTSFVNAQLLETFAGMKEWK